MQHSYTAILDTRCKAQPRGIPKLCPLCRRRHAIWVCLREVQVGTAGMFASALPTGRVALVGTGCAAKLLKAPQKHIFIPVYEEQKLLRALEDKAYITPNDLLYLQLYFEFANAPEST